MLLGWYYPDSIGGTENYVRMLSNELVNLGCEVIIAAPCRDEKVHQYEHEGILVYRYPVRLRGEIKPEYFDDYKKVIDEINPDIVHMHSLTRGCGFYHASYVKKLGLPLIFTIHIAEVTCARGTMMLWGEAPCDGEMKVDRCTACLYNKTKEEFRNLFRKLLA